MGGLTLVERMRDSVPGKNTLIKLSELHDAGLGNVVILRPGEPLKSSRDYGDTQLLEGNFDYLYIDTKWVERFTLGDESAVETLRKIWRKASQQRFKENEESQKEYEREKEEERLPRDERFRRMDERRAMEKRFKDKVQKRETEYRFLNPVALLQRLQEAQLVVAPAHVLSKLASEGNLTNLAELVDATSADSVSYAEKGSPNYARILVSPRKRGRVNEFDTVSRIDAETISLLFKPSDESSTSFFSLTSELTSPSLDDRFLGVLEGKTYISQVARTTFKPRLSQREQKAKELFGGLFSGAGRRHRKRDIPSNYYGLGGKPNGYRFVSNEFEESLVKKKRRAVLELYESLWLTPLDTLQEIHERQQFLEAIISNDEQAAAFSTLERGINSMVMPFLHLSGMASNISANILHSRWGAQIRKNDFYNDFMRIAGLFNDAYALYAKGFQNYAPEAREIKAFLGAAAQPNDPSNPLNKAHEFLEAILKAKPKDYEELKGLFAAELARSGAKLLPELEDYDHTKDPGVDMSKLPKKSEGKSLDGFRSPKLEGLLRQFHIKNPITQARDEVDYLDKLGTKFAAYEAIAAFIRQNGWVKPTVVHSERPFVDIKNGWYPLTRTLGNRIVRNGTSLGGAYTVEILDGINAGGKTIDMKKTFFIVVLALSGMYVPAESATVSMFDRVRFMLKDSGQGDQSALMKELSDIGYSLKAFGKQLLIGVDESFTSTNPLEGEAMTAGLIKHVSRQTSALAIFSSHYPALHEIGEFARGVKFAHFPFSERNGQIVFPHAKEPGPNLRGDYAIPIARSQSLHPEMLRIAEQYQGRGVK